MTEEKKVPATLAERARERVQHALADIYTDEELDAMVKQEIDAFFNKPTERFEVKSRRKDSSWQNHTIDYFDEVTGVQVSPCRLIIWNMCATMVMNRIAETASDSRLGIHTVYQTMRDEAGVESGMNITQMGEEIEKRAQKLAEENIGRMFSFMFAGMMNQSKAEMLMEFQSKFGMQQY
jgi:hypothetical protein